MSTVKAIYAGIRALGIDEEDDRRDLYERVTGKRRLREMTPGEKEGVLEELRRLGFRNPGARRMLTGPYAAKLQALWIAGWNLGLVRNREDHALIAFVKRQTGLDHVRFVREPADAAKAIEALKAWLARDGGVVWERTSSLDWLAQPGAKIALAQWRRLHPEATAQLRCGLDDVAKGLVRRPTASLAAFSAADWRVVCNALGERIRRMDRAA